MKKFILLFVLLCSCGSSYDLCDNDRGQVIKGLCVVDNGYPLNAANLKASLEITEEAFNSFFEDNQINLEDTVEHWVSFNIRPLCAQ